MESSWYFARFACADADTSNPTSTVYMPGGLSIASPAEVGMAAGESTARHPRAE